MNGENGDENWLSSWEQQCADALEEQPNYEQSMIGETNNSQTKIWTAFQDSATAVAQLYRDRYSGEPAAIWLQFQTAAGTVTSLYRESSEGLKKINELAKQSGYQKRNNELFNWAKKEKTSDQERGPFGIPSREASPTTFKAKPSPSSTPQVIYAMIYGVLYSRLSPRPRNISPPPGVAASDAYDSNLHTFREALLTSPLSCVPRGSDLCAFIAGEMARHTKRPASPSDVTMGSPTQQKRPRYM
ncbi:hypothetical protein NQ318_013981 [Aromia moschata]|uniref:Gag protein n=1 Tax=Aromia moschata TaxID=1265417 RepID=A0AAV8YZI7_9CUCU|nr:hypothetical protein NQ318_013981 [Aromia moschata]